MAPLLSSSLAVSVKPHTSLLEAQLPQNPSWDVSFLSVTVAILAQSTMTITIIVPSVTVAILAQSTMTITIIVPSEIAERSTHGKIVSASASETTVKNDASEMSNAKGTSSAKGTNNGESDKSAENAKSVRKGASVNVENKNVQYDHDGLLDTTMTNNILPNTHPRRKKHARNVLPVANGPRPMTISMIALVELLLLQTAATRMMDHTIIPLAMVNERASPKYRNSKYHFTALHHAER
jgi:hypothetical protein